MSAPEDQSIGNKRSALMGRVRQKNTAPEIAVRHELHKMGLRFRLHRRDLPGTPDIVLPRHRAAVFVHGCFWHRHQGCKKATTPRTHADFWLSKFARNIERDSQNILALQQAGWKVILVWECETADPTVLRDLLAERLK